MCPQRPVVATGHQKRRRRLDRCGKHRDCANEQCNATNGRGDSHASFAWPGNKAAIAATPAETARIADHGGCGALSVVDIFSKLNGMFG